MKSGSKVGLPSILYDRAVAKHLQPRPAAFVDELSAAGLRHPPESGLPATHGCCLAVASHSARSKIPVRSSGRSDCSYAERVALDLDYSTRWSLSRDLSILIRTVLEVLPIMLDRMRRIQLQRGSCGRPLG